VNIFDPNQWADAGGWWLLIAVAVGTLVLAATKVAGPLWDEWLDQPLGHSPPDDDWTRRGV
jgi:hypothetical protein